MNKIIHGAVLLSFAAAVASLWTLLTMMENLTPLLLEARMAPAFARFCFALKPALFILPVVAAAYCLFVWFRRAKPGDNWFGFFATTMTTAVLLLFPVLVAVVLPLIAALEQRVR